MKIKPEHYAVLEAAIKPVMTEIPFEQYVAQGLSPMRYRWDMLWKAGMNKWICDNLYPYINDMHIDSALRRITGVK